jgi:hypothetical protein
MGPTPGRPDCPEPAPRRQLGTDCSQRAASLEQGVAAQLTALQQPGEQTIRPVSSTGKIGERQPVPRQSARAIVVPIGGIAQETVAS